MSLNPEQEELVNQVIKTAWLYSAERFLLSVLGRTGQSFEGSVSFSYHRQYPEELQEGVTLDYLGEEIVLEETIFERCVLNYAHEHESQLGDLGLKTLIGIGKRA